MTRDVAHAAAVEQVVDTLADQECRTGSSWPRWSACCAGRGRWRGCAARRRHRAAARSARSCDDPLFGLHGGDELGLDAAIELGAVFLRDVGRRADDVLRQAQGIQGGLGLALVQQRAGVLDALLDVVGQLLPRDVLGRLGLLEGGLGIGAAGQAEAARPGPPRLRRRLAAPAGSCMATRTTPRSARSTSFRPRAAAALAGSSASAFLKKVSRRRARPLGERLAAQIGQLIRHRRLVGAEGRDTGQQHAAQHQEPGTSPRTRGSGHVRCSPAEGNDRLHDRLRRSMFLTLSYINSRLNHKPIRSKHLRSGTAPHRVSSETVACRARRENRSNGRWMQGAEPRCSIHPHSRSARDSIALCSIMPHSRPPAKPRDRRDASAARARDHLDSRSTLTYQFSRPSRRCRHAWHDSDASGGPTRPCRSV